jgi:gliding motility-associated-like protein
MQFGRKFPINGKPLMVFLFFFFLITLGYSKPLACNGSGGSLLVSTNQVCASTNSFTLTLVGYTGNILGWQSSIDQINWSTLSGVNLSLNSFSNIANTTYYRVSLDSGACSYLSGVATVVAFAASQGGVLSGSSQVCSGTNSGTVVLSGYVGSIVGWVSSIDNFNNDVEYIATTSSFLQFTNIITTTSFKARIQNGVCPIQRSAAATITIIQSDTGVYVGGDSALIACGGTNQVSITIDPSFSNIVKWQTSSDSFLVDIQNVASTASSIVFKNINNTTYYRAALQRGACSVAYSKPFVAKVLDQALAGTVDGSEIYCSSISGNGVLTFTGLGSIIKWQSSIDNFLTVIDISTTGSFLPYSSLNQTTSFRVISTSASSICPVSYSTIAKIIVNGSQSQGGAILPKSYSYCSTTNNSTFTLYGASAPINHWESSPNINFSTYSIVSTTTPNGIFVQNLSTVTYFRALVQGNIMNSCSSAYSDIVVVNATPVADGYYQDVNDSICAGGSAGPINFIGYTGYIDHWEVSTDKLFGIPKKYVTSQSTFTISPNLTTTSYFRAILVNGNCRIPGTPSYTYVHVDSLTNGGIPVLGQTGTLCVTTNSGVIRLTGYTGKIQYWESLINGISNPISNTTSSLSITGVLIPSSYRVSVKNGKCNAAYSNYLNVTIDSLSLPGSNSGTLNLSNSRGNFIQWQVSTDNFSTYTAYNSNSSSFSFNNLTTTSEIKAVVQNNACPATITSFVTLSTTSPPVGGYLIGANEVCANSSAYVNLQIAGTTDKVADYNYSYYPDSSFSSFTPYPWHVQVLTVNYITASVYYKFDVYNSACLFVVPSKAHLIIASPPSIGGTITGLNNIISGQSATLSLTGFTGTVVSWQLSTGAGFSTYSNIASITSFVTLNNIIKDTYVRAVVKSGSCASAYSTNFLISAYKDLICRDTSVYHVVGTSISTTSSFSLFGLSDYQYQGKASLITANDSSTILGSGNLYSIYSNGLWSYKTDGGLNNDGFNYTLCLNGFIPAYCKTCKVNILVEDTLEAITVFTALSPNGDNINDTLVIENLPSYPNNKVSIFNRWGSLVYQQSGYDNKNNFFIGKSNVGFVAGGDELPSATYFYVIDYGNGLPNKKGYIVLNR